MYTLLKSLLNFKFAGYVSYLVTCTRSLPSTAACFALRCAFVAASDPAGSTETHVSWWLFDQCLGALQISALHVRSNAGDSRGATTTLKRTCQLIDRIVRGKPYTQYSRALCTDLDRAALQYSDQDYWNERYSKAGGTSFEWYQRYDSLKHIITPLIPKDSTILQVSALGLSAHHDRLRCICVF